MKRWTAGMLSALVVLAAGCGSRTGAREITIVATDHKFEPALIEMKPGETVKFTIVNKGTVDHEFESEDLQFDELEIPPGKSRSVEVTMPSKPGEYKFFCDAPGHLDAGMAGKVLIK